MGPLNGINEGREDEETGPQIKKSSTHPRSDFQSFVSGDNLASELSHFPGSMLANGEPSTRTGCSDGLDRRNDNGSGNHDQLARNKDDNSHMSFKPTANLGNYTDVGKYYNKKIQAPNIVKNGSAIIDTEINPEFNTRPFSSNVSVASSSQWGDPDMPRPSSSFVPPASILGPLSTGYPQPETKSDNDHHRPDDAARKSEIEITGLSERFSPETPSIQNHYHSLKNSFHEPAETLSPKQMNKMRIFAQNAKAATREINVAEISLIIDADELTSLPESFLDAIGKDSVHQRSSKSSLPSSAITSEKESKQISNDYVAYDLLPPPNIEPSPFSKPRRCHSIFTMFAAFALAFAGLYCSVDSLSSRDPATGKKKYGVFGGVNNGNDNFAAASTVTDNSSSGYFFIPGYQFGGGIGGIIGGHERDRLVQLGYDNDFGRNIENNPILGPKLEYAMSAGEGSIGEHHLREPSSSVASSKPPGLYSLVSLSKLSSQSQSSSPYHLKKPPDPYAGLGPPQLNPEYSNLPSPKARLSSTPLTSYTPPKVGDYGSELEKQLSSESKPPLVLDPHFHGAMMDLSVLPFNSIREIPIFWDVPLSGGSGVESAFGNCLKLVQCSEIGRKILTREFEEEGGLTSLNTGTGGLVAGSHERSRHLLVEKKSFGLHRSTMQIISKDDGSIVHDDADNNEVEAATENDQEDYVLEQQKHQEGNVTLFDPPLKVEFAFTSNYINVDCTTPEGVDRGIARGLAMTNIVDIIYSPDIYDVARLFAPPTQAYGRAIALLRHPLEREVARYEYLKAADRNEKTGTLSEMTLEEYARSDRAEDNFLTRSLSKNTRKPLRKRDLNLAKEILERKFIVGLFDQMDESIQRFETFFGWNLNDDALHCQQNEIKREVKKHYNKFSVHDNSNEGKEMHPGLTQAALAALAEKNRFDLLIFDMARFLFDYQGQILFGVASTFDEPQLE